jgi:hypothetical protein
MKGELLVAQEKPGQFSLLTAYLVPVYGDKYIFLSTFEITPFFCVFPVYEYNAFPFQALQI